MTFQAWKMKFLNSMTFSIFHDLHKPCSYKKNLKHAINYLLFQATSQSQLEFPTVQEQ